MQRLEPQRVCNKDILNWFKQSFELINRRIVANVSVISVFFLVLFFCTQSMLASQASVSPVLLIFGFLVFTAFIFYLTMTALVIVSHCSDASHAISVNEIFHCILPNQKMLLKLSVIAISVGLFFWYMSILMNPASDILIISEKLIRSFSNDQQMLFYIMKTGIVFLFFVILVKLSLRSLFSLPLILFHDLSYESAQRLSHKGIVKNFKVMINVLIFWAFCALIAIKFAPVLVVLLLPLFACFIYVAYRHIYLGEGLNEKSRVIHRTLADSHV